MYLINSFVSCIILETPPPQHLILLFIKEEISSKHIVPKDGRLVPLGFDNSQSVESGILSVKYSN